jgi:hypothetical protein
MSLAPGEVQACLSAGAAPTDLLYSNPVKRTSDIAAARQEGVRRFVADSDGEIAKLAVAAPGAEVLIRIGTSGEGSDWPLSGKFGCAPKEAVALLRQAADLGLGAAGIAFHVGSQQRDPSRWQAPIARPPGPSAGCGNSESIFAYWTLVGVCPPPTRAAFRALASTGTPSLAHSNAISTAILRS